MILGNPKNHKQLCARPVWRAKFPKGSAHCVNTRSRHIDRTKTTMRGKILGTKLLGPPSCQTLRLIAASEKSQP